MYILILYLPFISFLLLSIFGRFFGKNGSSLIAIFSMLLSFIFSLIVFYEIALSHSNCIINLFPWLNVGFLNINWCLLFDTLTVVMLFIITFISLLVHLYSL